MTIYIPFTILDSTVFHIEKKKSICAEELVCDQPWKSITNKHSTRLTTQPFKSNHVADRTPRLHTRKGVLAVFIS